jgi:hypothetical protein
MLDWFEVHMPATARIDQAAECLAAPVWPAPAAPARTGAITRAS